MKRKFLDEIQIARAIAIFGVLFVHCTSTGVMGTPHDSFMFPIYNFLNSMATFATPVFIFLSGFVLFYSYYEKDLNLKLIKAFYSKRLLYILLPYFIISGIYFLVKLNVYSTHETLLDFLRKLSNGNAHTHLYYLYISVQFYVMLPIFLFLFKKSNFLKKWSILLGVLIQWGWNYTNAAYFQVSEKGSISLSYMMFFLFGAFLAMHYERIIDFSKNIKKSFWLLVITFVGAGYFLRYHTGITLLNREGYNGIPSMEYEFAWSTYSLLAGLVILIISFYLAETISVKRKSIFMEIGAVSFGIYLIHPLLLMYLRTVVKTGSPLVFHGWQLITFLITFLLSWLVVRLFYNYVPYSWILFGKDSNKKIQKS